MKKLLYIASLPHSGSTLLDMMLGGHPHCVGLGEVARFLEQELENSRRSVCSCGKSMDDCEFWSKVAQRLESSDKTELAEKYAVVFEVFDEVFGHDRILIDSSKHLPPLEILHSHFQGDLAVLFLMRDVRSAAISRLDNLRRKGQLRGRQWIQQSPIYIFWQWYRRNKRMQQFFQDHDLKVFQLGYEELCLYPEQMLQKICHYMEEEWDPAMLRLHQTSSHVLRGNRMRYQPEKSQIRYDHRWFLRQEWNLPAFMFPNIMHYNSREVYRNHTEAVWKR